MRSSSFNSGISPNDTIVSSTLLLKCPLQVLFQFGHGNQQRVLGSNTGHPVERCKKNDHRTKSKTQRKRRKQDFFTQAKILYIKRPITMPHWWVASLRGMASLGQNEHLKKLICVLEQIWKRVYGQNATIPKRLLNAFLLDTNEINKLVSHQAKNTAKVLPYQYLTKLNGEDCVISGLVTRPLQFTLGKIPTMSSILDKPGDGWEDINEGEYFKCSEGQREDVIMSTSKDFKECYIIYSMMKWIRVTNIKKNMKNDRLFKRRFKIRCAMDIFQVNNKSIQAGTVICSRMMTMTFIWWGTSLCQCHSIVSMD